MPVYRTDDPIRDFENFEEDRERELEKCPVCTYCGEHIQDAFAFHIDNEWWHESCLRNEFYMEVC